MGASVAGILGAILAAPLLASLKLVTIYAWRKLFDQPPFPDYDPILQPETAELEELEETGADSITPPTSTSPNLE
jgi:hypothetical protein